MGLVHDTMHPMPKVAISQILSKIKTLSEQQPPASDFTKEAVELDKMCVSEIVAKYESSHNAITVLKRKLRQACESDKWMESATKFYENGGCPICFSTDEAGCKEGCYLGQLQARLDSAVAACEIGLQIGEWISQLSNRPKALAEDIETIKAAIALTKSKSSGMAQ